MLVDIICGFLGAGKTTLINKLTAVYKQKGEKIVVIENEYGSVNIDKFLFEDQAMKVYEMTSGCLCCTLKGSLELSLQEIKNVIKPDRVVIEPSGIFVIDEILDVFNTAAFKDFKLNQIITVVDSQHFIKYRHKYNALLGMQIKKADVIIASKLNAELDTDLLEKNIRDFNSIAPIVMKPWEALSLEELEMLITKKQSARKFIQKRIKKASPIIYQKQTHVSHHFKTETIKLKEDYTKEQFDLFVTKLNDKNILRCKGFISIGQINYLFQYINGSYSLQEASQSVKDHTLVLIENM